MAKKPKIITDPNSSDTSSTLPRTSLEGDVVQGDPSGTFGSALRDGDSGTFRSSLRDGEQTPGPHDSTIWPDVVPHQPVVVTDNPVEGTNPPGRSETLAIIGPGLAGKLTKVAGDLFRYDKQKRIYVDVIDEGTVMVHKNTHGDYQATSARELTPSGPVLEPIEGTTLWQRKPQSAMPMEESQPGIPQQPPAVVDLGPGPSKRPRSLTLRELEDSVSLKAAAADARQVNRGITQLGKRSMKMVSPGAIRYLVSVNPTTWTPLRTGDQLSNVGGIDNVPVRNTGDLVSRDYRLIDSSTNHVFGPSYLEPRTAISNVIYQHYAAPASCIAGLTHNGKGIYRSVDGQRCYICNVDESGSIAVYQVRDNFNLTADIVSVDIVNYRTNEHTGLQVSSVKAGQWQKIRLEGETPEDYNLVTHKHLEEWQELNDSVEEMAISQFTTRYRLDPQDFRQYAQLSVGLTGEGQQVLLRARNVQTAITAKHLRHWETQSQEGRDGLTQEGFANRHNLNPASFMEHIDQYGKLKAAGKVLVKHAKGEEFTSITYEHLEAWQALYKSQTNKITAGDFAEKNNLNPVRWGTYVDETGALKQSGKDLVILGEPTPRPHLARKGSARHDTSEGTKRPAEESLPGSSKRPRPDPEAAQSSERPHLDHDIDNSLPILQDPKNVKESLTLKAEGPSGLEGRESTVGEIEVTYWNQLLDQVSKTKRLRLQEDITVEVRDWIRNENNLAPRFDKLMEVKVLSNGPERGRSVVAKRDIERFEVLGPYSGKLHLGSKTLREEISEKGHKAVNSYTFSTFSNDGTLSAHGSGNILSLINSPNAPGRPSLGSENVASINVGRYMTFFVAWKEIKKGGELLLDYGDGYDWT
ncbi:hypothetical protein PS914_04821 [Pseudomonas fluorescens]|uniref:SET domain-containing protein-lysine N-methyltransferase n=1 Tax=Pseudomonas fluorescens TaxID=294 RepID=UPI0012430FA5|nr:SET domain-containing protein-lysine N-methyltransferase [Pseudomonas fluorescens]VVQ08192.1 hypothetical protein PS914_04821 [Pseudomonas fluorescens]